MAARRLGWAGLVAALATSVLSAVAPASADTAFDSSWGYSYCYPEGSDCVHEASADPSTSALHVAVSATAAGAETGGRGVQQLTGHGELANNAGSALFTAVVRLDRTDAAATGDGVVNSNLLISASVDSCAGAGCLASGTAPLLSTTAAAGAVSRTGDNATVQVRLRNLGGGNLPSGPVTYSVAVDGAATAGATQPANSSADVHLDLTVLSVTIEPDAPLVPVQITRTAPYVGGGVYQGAQTPTPCGLAPAPVIPGVVCIPVPEGVTDVRVALHDDHRAVVGGAVRTNLAPGWTDESFCGTSGAKQVQPGSGWLVVFPDGLTSACGAATTGTVTATFTGWV